MPKFFDTSSDRRRAPRTKLAEIAYIGMGPENGGLVLDVSDGGLSFHSVAPVQPAEEIRFLLSLRGHSRIEGAGEVVWTNEMRTVCGLRFTSLSSGAREHLNNWTNQTRTPVTARFETEKAPQFAKPALPDAGPLAPSPNAVPVFTIPSVSETPLTFPETRSIWQKPVFLWILFAVLASILSVVAFQYGIRVGKSQVAAVPQPAVSSEAPGNPPALAPAPIPAASVPSDANSAPAGAPASPGALAPESRDAVSAPNNIAPVPALATSTPSGALVNASKSEDATPARTQTSDAKPKPAGAPDRSSGQSVEAGKSQLKAALGYLNGDNGRKDIPAAVHLLWAAVANGNAEAEVTLADLYATGDVIPKNCDQARVLLRAAAKTGSALGEEKLQDLNTNGCP